MTPLDEDHVRAKITWSEQVGRRGALAYQILPDRVHMFAHGTPADFWRSSEMVA
jgi:hypothetical protein